MLQTKITKKVRLIVLAITLITLDIHALPTANPLKRWLVDPIGVNLVIGITNLYADTDAYLEIKIGEERRVFYGAGIDHSGNYIPTNYPAVKIPMALRREYPLLVSCTNTGPSGSPFFKTGDFFDAEGMVQRLMNYEAPSGLSEFLWTNLTSQAQFALTNASVTTEDQQTNLVRELNRIMLEHALYETNRFSGTSLSQETTNLLAQNPLGPELRRLNRLLLNDAYANYNHFITYGQIDNSGTAEIYFSVLAPTEFDTKNLKIPQEYTILTNRHPFDRILNLEHPPEGFISTNRAQIEIVKEKFANAAIADGCDDPRPSPGDGTSLALGPGGTAETNRIALDWSVSLGRLFDGLAAGRLRIRESELSRKTYTPFSIYYNAASTNIRNQTILISTNASGNLRQVKAYQTFVDILTPDTNQTVMKFYFPSQIQTNVDENGVFTNIVGSEFVSWTIQNPEPSTTNKLLIIESRNGESRTNELIRESSGGYLSWTLTQGEGNEKRVETRDISFVGTPVVSRIETNSIRYANSGEISHKAIETYSFYSWGAELSEVRIPNSSDHVTTYTYYTNQMDEFSYGKIDSTIYPDGFWEKRVYQNLGYSADTGYCYEDGLLRYIVSPRLDNGLTPDAAGSADTVFDEYSYCAWGPGTVVWRYNGASASELTTELINRPITRLDGEAKVIHSQSAVRDIRGDYQGWFETWNAVYDDSAPVGLAGHVYGNHRPGMLGSFHYYDHGTFDPELNTFIMDPTNHLYVGGETATYTDHRETEITSFRFGGDGGGGLWINAWVQDSYWDDLWNKFGDDYSYIEDHPLLYYSTSIGLYPNKTQKKVSIYKNGNLAQTEHHVYTGKVEEEAQWELLFKDRYYVDSLGRATNIVRIDGMTGRELLISSADYRGGTAFDGPLLVSDKDEAGMQRIYSYDGLRRIKTITTKGAGSQADQVVSYAYDVMGRKLSEVATSGTLSLVSAWSYDAVGRETNRVGSDGIVRGTIYSSDGRSVTNFMAGNVQSVLTHYLDRKVKSLEGSNTVSEFYDYDCGTFFNQTVHRKTTRFGSPTSSRWRIEGTDVFGHKMMEQYPSTSGSSDTEWKYYAFMAGWPIYETSSSGLEISRYNDITGQPRFELAAAEGEAFLRFKGIDSSFVSVDGVWYSSTTNWTAPCTRYGTQPNGVGVAPTREDGVFLGATLNQVSGFASNELSREILYDANTNRTIATRYVDASSKQVKEVTQSDTSQLSATNVIINGLLQSASSLTVAVPTRYNYDSLGREISITTPLGFTASKVYDSKGNVQSTTDYTRQTKFYEYYPNEDINAGKVKSFTNNGKKTFYSYTPRGELYRTWGDVPYPEERVYSDYGELVTLRTYRGGTGWNSSTWPSSPGAADTTTWTYDEPSGMLTSKADNNNESVTYTYTNGMIFTRTWARGVTVTNSYNGFGDLVAMDYNDNTPSVVLTNFNWIGMPTQIIDGTGTNDIAYDHAGHLVSVTGTDGIYEGITVSNRFDPTFGRDLLLVTGLSTNLTNTFGYDNYGRLGSVSNGINSATYVYLPNSDLLQTTTFKSGSTNVMMTTRQWDYGSRLQSIANTVDGVAVTSHSHLYDQLNRRRQATLEDGSLWKYEYNDRDELISGRRFWSDWTPVVGQQFEYGFDNIGNRKSAKEGGDVNGANLRTENYTANGLNQYTTRTVPDKMDVIGGAYATATVTVNNNNTYRKGEYYHYALGVTNSLNPAWVGITNKAVIGANTESLTNHALIPPATQTLQYDKDGNLTNDAVWVYSWDGENRLIQMANLDTISPEARKKLTFGYDYMSRRATKTVYKWDSGAANWSTTAELDQKFIYDGWNLIALMNAESSFKTFTWGQDISGTWNGAGGVSGLLMTFVSGTNCFVGYDGNGNITTLVGASDKAIAARYEYNPFGKSIRTTGPQAKSNPFRFSSKYTDDETDLVYYTFRYYSTTSGRWLSRDPILEVGGLNLYAFVFNNTPESIDGLGDKKFYQTSDGYEMRVDPFNKGGESSFEVHIKYKGNEVGIFTKDGFINKHGISGALADANLPDHIKNKVNGIGVDIERRAGRLPPRRPSITNGRMGGGAHLKAGAGLMLIGALVLASEGTAHAEALAGATMEHLRFKQSGDVGFADLAAIDVALAIQAIAGDSFLMYTVLGALLE